jgi:hypothetical protein
MTIQRLRARQQVPQSEPLAAMLLRARWSEPVIPGEKIGEITADNDTFSLTVVRPNRDKRDGGEQASWSEEGAP